MADLFVRSVQRRGARIDVADEEVFPERCRAGKNLALGSKDDAVAVEDQLVLATDCVGVRDVGTVVRGAAGDHVLTWGALAYVVRRTVDVDQQLRAVVRLPRHRAGRVPAVLADGDPDADPGLLEDRTAMAGGEVALLVEDAVVGQEDFVINRLELAITDEGG